MSCLRRRQAGGCRAALFVLVCVGVAGVAGQLAALNEDLLEYELSWMPWKKFNYSVPSAVNYCPHQHCMRCSEPFEWDPHPYVPCRAVPPPNNGTKPTDTVKLEIASSHLPFDGLLLCFTAPKVNLSENSVEIDLITEGGTLYDTEGKVVYSTGITSSFFTTFVGKVSGDRYLESVEYGVLSDFLGNDEYYAKSFEYQRYDQFRTWEYTSKIAAGLVRSESGGGGANCMLLTSAYWKQRTRYELTMTFLGPRNVNVSQHPVWMAPLKYEEYSGDLTQALGVPITEELEGSSKVVLLAMGVRGPKQGAVCHAATEAPGESTRTPHNCSVPGFVTSPRSGECITCPRLNDLVRDKTCQLLEKNATVQWSSWTNEGLRSNNVKYAQKGDEGECCASNTYPQLIGDKACGGMISPNPADTDLSPSKADIELGPRLCSRYGYARDVFENMFCPLECLQDGNLDFRKRPFGNLERPEAYRLFGSRCSCNITLMMNASRLYNDAYMARALIPDFMYEAASLVDEYSLGRVIRLARSQGMDLDKRRQESPTRLRGLNKIWIGEVQGTRPRRGNTTFFDMYNKFVDFALPSRAAESVHEERGYVEDFDTQYYAELNLRYLGILLADDLVSAAPYTCGQLFDPTSANATEGLMWGHRDPYWPTWGHPADEF